MSSAHPNSTPPQSQLALAILLKQLASEVTKSTPDRLGTQFCGCGIRDHSSRSTVGRIPAYALAVRRSVRLELEHGFLLGHPDLLELLEADLPAV